MNTLILTVSMLLLSLISSRCLHAQEKMVKDDLQAILYRDSIFWQHYNNCDVDKMRSFFTDDVEFYHDKGGMIKGLDNFLSVSKANLCSNDNFRLRRDAVAGSVKVFPLKKDETIYGAILSGQHVFYVLEKGKEPQLDGLAKFTHLLMKTESGWKMSRVLSYDHGPAPYVNERKEMVLNEEVLKRYVGKYQAPRTGLCDIKHADGLLLLTIGDKIFTLHPESETKFFATDRDLTFEFIEDKMIVREKDKIVEAAIRIN